MATQGFGLAFGRCGADAGRFGSGQAAARIPGSAFLQQQLRRERAAREAEWVLLGATMHLWR